MPSSGTLTSSFSTTSHSRIRRGFASPGPSRSGVAEPAPFAFVLGTELTGVTAPRLKRREGRRRAELRAVDPGQPGEGRHPERPPAGADRFAAFETYAGQYIQAVGDARQRGPTRRRGSAIAIGPQYGTVSPSYVKKAAREAINAEDVDLLCDPRLRLRPPGHRTHRGRRRHGRGHRRGLRQRRGRAAARPHPGADGADER